MFTKHGINGGQLSKAEENNQLVEQYFQRLGSCTFSGNGRDKEAGVL